MKRSVLLLTMIVLTGCADPPKPIVVSQDLLCTQTTRYHATEAQRAIFKADPDVWMPLVDWLGGFDIVRDSNCK